MFGSSSKSSSASSQSGASINSSGWAVGTSSASGGSLEASSSTGFKLPTAAYISGAIIVFAFIYFKNKKAK